MYLKSVPLLASAFTFFSILHLGNSLDCYHCNVTVSSYSHTIVNPTEQSCGGSATLQKCQDPAVCLAATYSQRDSKMKVTSTIIKTCYIHLGGENLEDRNECNIFMKNIRTVYPLLTDSTGSSERCTVCLENGCNHFSGDVTTTTHSPKPDAASNVSVFFVMTLFPIILSKLL